MQSTTIFIADDDPDDLLILSEALQSRNSTIGLVYASDGEDALQLLDQLVEKKELPGLIILDLNMPRRGGSQTLEAIKSKSELVHIPVVIYTTSINPFEKAKCLELGAVDYIVKPISIEESVAIAEIFLKLSAQRES